MTTTEKRGMVDPFLTGLAKLDTANDQELIDFAAALGPFDRREMASSARKLITVCDAVEKNQLLAQIDANWGKARDTASRQGEALLDPTPRARQAPARTKPNPAPKPAQAKRGAAS